MAQTWRKHGAKTFPILKDNEFLFIVLDRMFCMVTPNPHMSQNNLKFDKKFFCDLWNLLKPYWVSEEKKVAWGLLILTIIIVSIYFTQDKKEAPKRDDIIAAATRILVDECSKK